MNLMLLFSADFLAAPDRAVITDPRRLRHLNRVIRPKLGDTVTVGLLNGPIGEGEVRALSDREAVLEVAWERPPPRALPVTLLMALPRPKSLFKLLQPAATMGVKAIHLFNCSRVDKSYWQSRLLEQEALREHLLLGLEQARDTLLPTVTLHRLFAPFVNDALPLILPPGARRVLAHPAPDAAPCPPAWTEPVVLALGPERGLVPHEVNALEERGFEVVALGERVLKTEQALMVLLGRAAG